MKQIKDLDPATGIYGLTEWEADCYGNGNSTQAEEWRNGQTVTGRLKYNQSYNYTGQYDVAANRFDIDNYVTDRVIERFGQIQTTPPAEVSNKLIHAIGFNPGRTSMPAMPSIGVSGNVPLPALVDVVMGDSGTSFGAIDFSELDITLPEINNVYPPPPVPPLSDFIVPQQTIAAAFMSGLWTGVKANVNGLSSAVVSTATLGIIDKVEPMKVTDLDRAYGYDTAVVSAQFSGTLLTGLGSGGIGCWSKGGSAMVRTVGTTARAMDIGGNVVGAGKNAYDIYENGASFGNVLGFAGNTFGLVGNLSQACFAEGTQIVVGMEYIEDEHGNLTTVYTTANIEDIQVGDYVYSYDTVTDALVQSVVTNTLHRYSDHLRYIEVIDENGVVQRFETTDAHPFWVENIDADDDRAVPGYVLEYDPVTGETIWIVHENTEGNAFGGYVCAGDLRVGDVCIGPNGERLTVISSQRESFPLGIAVYNLEVEGTNNYYVIANNVAYVSGAAPVMVHNGGCLDDFLDPNLYKGIKYAPNYPQGFIPVKTGGTTFHKVKDTDIKAVLNQEVSGKWRKVYKDGMLDGERVSLHYFQNEKTQEICGLKIILGWSNY